MQLHNEDDDDNDDEYASVYLIVKEDNPPSRKYIHFYTMSNQPKSYSNTPNTCELFRWAWLTDRQSSNPNVFTENSVKFALFLRAMGWRVFGTRLK